MGNKIRSLIPCFCKYKFNSPKIDEGSLDDDDKIKLKENTKFEFYCPECEKNEEIAEILKIYSDNGKMKIKCPNKPKEFDLSFEDYCAKIEKKIKKPCDGNGGGEVGFFCLGCKKYFHEKEILQPKTYHWIVILFVVIGVSFVLANIQKLVRDYGTKSKV